MNNINMDELIADREAGGPGNAIIGYLTSTPWGEAQRRRIDRLPDLETAYIEAVELIREVREHLADGNIGKAIVRIDRGPLEPEA